METEEGLYSLEMRPLTQEYGPTNQWEWGKESTEVRSSLVLDGYGTVFLDGEGR